MATKKNAVSAKTVFEPKVLEPKFVKKAKMFCITTFNTDGKQKIEWEHTKELADKKFESIKASLAK